MPNAASRSTFDWRILAGIALIAGGIAVAYQPALHGGFIWDDELLISNNELVQAPDGLYRIWFTRERSIIGQRPTPRFGSNGICGEHHTIPFVQLCPSLRRFAVGLASAAEVANSRGIFGGMLFAVHPVNVESVAWIAQRKNLLAMLFALVSVWSYLKSVSGKPIKPRPLVAPECKR